MSEQKTWKWFLGSMVIGSLVAVGLTSIYMPRAIEWYFDPPVGMGISCKDPIAWALARLQLVQLISLGAGAVLGLIIAFRFRKSPQQTIPKKN